MKKRIAFLLFLLMIAFSLCFSLGGCASFGGAGGTTVYPVEAYRTTMQYYDDFKVLQLADLHLGVESDVAKQLDIVKNAIRSEQPDLVVLTGDNFMYASKGVVKALVSALNAECKAVTEERGGRLTKFTMTFGNHDNQGDYPRYYINEVISSYVAADGEEIAEGKYAAFVDYEDDAIFGLTNFYIDLVDDRAKSRDTVDVKYRLHVIDSNTYHFVGPDYDYDVIRGEQLGHAVDIYERATVDKTYIGMAFFHIPLFEYLDAYEAYLEEKDAQPVKWGEFGEGVLHGYENNGSFETLRSANIVAYFCGHDHINYCDYIYRGESEEFSDNAILSYGVKTTNQLYHDVEMIGYKTVILRDITPEEFVTEENISENFKNVTGGYSHYENG